MSFLNWILCILIGYLLGCFPTATLVCRLYGKDDVRNHGSGNAGSTNMLRVYGFQLGLITLVGDVVKALLAVLIGWALGVPTLPINTLPADQIALIRTTGGCVCGIAAVVGHDFPAFSRFRGGKGVASSFGVMVMLSPVITLVCAVIFFAGALTTRIVSLFSMISITLIPILMLIFGWPAASVITGFILAVLVIFSHRSNIARLRAGTENKLNF